MLMMMHQEGRALGLADDAAFQLGNLDLAYGMRILLPCISEPRSSWYLVPFAGVSAARARADDDEARPVFEQTPIARDFMLSLDLRAGLVLEL